jgi:multidrug efflux system membrane fusion protein
MKSSYWIALGVAVAATLWMASGLLTRTETVAKQSPGEKVAPELIRVQTATFTADEVERELVLHGHTAAARLITLKAETAGYISNIAAPRGAFVERGAILLQFADDGRNARLSEAQALIRQRELEYKASKSLKEKGLRAETQMAEAETLLESARSQLATIQVDIEKTSLRAPFAGVLETRPVELGDYLGVGDPVATIVELDPFIVVADVSEQEIGRIRPGDAASVKLITGEEYQGRIRYIAAAADAATRTFTVELEVPNPEGRRLLGITAEIHFPLGRSEGHRLPSSLLSLNDAGVIGVKGVNEEGVVHFYPVTIVKTDTDGVWLGGLPRQVQLITVGQDFVRDGDRVKAMAQQKTL